MKKDTTIEQRIKIILIDNLGVSDEEVTGNASLMDDLGADSLDVVEIVMAVEEEFEIEVPNEQAEEIRTVKQMVDYVTKLTGGK